LYTATIVDANGCTFEFADIEVLQVSASGAVTNVACEGGADGAIDLTVNSGIGPYTYAWRVMGNPAIIATTQDLMDISAGTYEVVVTDASGQSFTLAFTVSTTLGFSLTTAVTSNYNGSAVSCNGNTDGSARVDISGFGDFDFQWFSGTTLVGSDSILTGIGAGTYRVVVTNENGCFAEDSVTVTEPMPLSLTSEITAVSCFNERDGRIRLTVSGGTPDYSYEWSNGGTLNQIQFLEEGDYEVFINDANGCIINQDFTVAGPPELIATVESTDATDDCNGTVTVIPLAGGSTNFNYNWQQLPQQGNSPVALDLCPGDYIIDVFDENRCQTVTVVATVRDRRFPCLSERNVITPNGDGLNESFILFCTDGGEINNNTLEIYNRWGQLVYQIADYNCSTDGGLNCFEGRTNDGSVLPAGPYYYVLDYTNPIGELQQKRGSITIVLE
jgi:gliding motility-associated-like protein